MEKSTIHLSPEISVMLRRAVNDDVDISITHEKERSHGNGKLYPAWNRICALMDRIQDTAEHINNIELHNEKENRSAFSFIDLMNYGSVLIDCIYEIARIYEVDLSKFEQSSDVFHNTGKDNRGSDKKYFEYLRSLCSVHPIDTSRHSSYQDTDFECCPYVCWSADKYHREGYNYLEAQVYTNKETGNYYKVVTIPLSSIIMYIEDNYKRLETIIIPGIEAFKEHQRDTFRKQSMKHKEDFSDYIDYLVYLKEELHKRYREDDDYLIDNTIRFFKMSFENPLNERCLVKYQNALKLAIDFFHASLQNMDCEGYQNTGIRFPSEDEGTSLLYCLLYMRNNSKEACIHGYEIGTLHELYSDNDSGYYAMSQLERIKPFLERYVLFDEAKTHLEYYILSQLALYADSLRHKNILNQNIPNEMQYRFRRLSDKEWDNLHQERKRNQSADVTYEEYLRLCNMYLGNNENSEDM